MGYARAAWHRRGQQSGSGGLIGFSVVAGLGITATAQASRFCTAVHRGLLYLVFLIFFLAFAHNAARPVRMLAVVLAGALLLRMAAAAQNLWNPQNAPRVKFFNSKS